MSLWARVYEERRRVILPIAILATVSVATWFLAVWPLQESVVANETAAVQATVDLANARRTAGQVRAAAENKGRADSELQTFYADVLPHDLDTARKTTNRWLQQAARDAGLEFKGSHFSWEAIRESRLSRAVSTVTLVGRYASIRRFLYAVETASEFIVVEKVGLAQATVTEQGSNGALEVSLVVATYFVTPSAP